MSHKNQYPQLYIQTMLTGGRKTMQKVGCDGMELDKAQETASKDKKKRKKREDKEG